MRKNDITFEQIRVARLRGTANASDFAAFKIDWSLTNKDKRSGTMHAWKANGEYVGQFRTHRICLEHGAAVTRLDGLWFDWRENGTDNRSPGQ